MTALTRAITVATEGVRVWPRWLVLGVAGVAFLLLFGLPTIIVPLATDQVLFSLGARTVLNGDRLYADFFEIKAPLIYLIYAVPFALTGEHTESIRVLDLINTGVAMAGVFLVTQRYFNERAAMFGAAFYAFSYLTWAHVDGLAEIESFMAAPLAFGVYFYRAEDGDRGRALAAVSGLLFGLAFALKTTAILFVLVPVAIELLGRRDAGWTRRAAIERLAFAGAGFLIVTLAWVLYLAASGVLDEFIDIQRHYTGPYNAYRLAPRMSHGQFVFLTTGDFLRDAAFITAPAALGLFFALARPREARGAFVFGLAIFLAFAGVWWQGKMFRYHWVLLLPLMAPLAGYGADRVVSLVPTLPRPQAIAATAVLVAGFLLLASHPLFDTYDGYRYTIRRMNGSLSQREIEERYNFQLRDNHALVDYVKANSAPEDELYVWGLWPVNYFWLDRPVPTRFVANFELRATWAPESWRRELVKDLEASPPRYIAVARGDDQPWLVGTSETSEEHLNNSYPALRTFLTSRYHPVRDFGLFLLYERNPASVRALR